MFKTIFLIITEIIKSFFKKTFDLNFLYCPKCKKKKIFIKYGNSPTSIRCLGCSRTIKPLSILTYVKELKLNSNSYVYELSFHGPVFDYLKSNFKNFYFSEFYPSRTKGEKINNVFNQDVQDLTFQDDFFDFISCTEVFEHVPEYLIGFSEIYRTLKKGGVFCFTVPLYSNLKTEHLCEIDESGNLRWLGKPEFHDSRITGPNTVPVFWKNSENQIIQDLKKTGFKEAKIKYDYSFSKLVPAKIIIASK